MVAIVDTVAAMVGMAAMEVSDLMEATAGMEVWALAVLVIPTNVDFSRTPCNIWTM